MIYLKVETIERQNYWTGKYINRYFQECSNKRKKEYSGQRMKLKGLTCCGQLEEKQSATILLHNYILLCMCIYAHNFKR